MPRELLDDAAAAAAAGSPLGLLWPTSASNADDNATRGEPNGENVLASALQTSATRPFGKSLSLPMPVIPLHFPPFPVHETRDVLISTIPSRIRIVRV